MNIKISDIKLTRALPNGSLFLTLRDGRELKFPNRKKQFNLTLVKD